MVAQIEYDKATDENLVLLIAEFVPEEVLKFQEHVVDILKSRTSRQLIKFGEDLSSELIKRCLVSRSSRPLV